MDTISSGIVSDRSRRSEEERDFDCRLLEESGLVDVAAYRAAAGLSEDANAAEHYLLRGWRQNLEPNPNFEGNFLYPYYRSAGFDGPPALTFLMLRAAGSAVCATRAEAHALAAPISSSPLFDASGYAARAGGLEELDPALHYVLVGEDMGLSPSPAFDPEYYGARYPDVSNGATNLLHHYLSNGRAEGRRPTSVSDAQLFEQQRLDRHRRTILLFVHDASRTGAPIIAYNIAVRLGQKYNVVAVVLDGGELLADFQSCCAAVVGPLSRPEWCEAEARRLVSRLCTSYDVCFAIANSIETRLVLPPLAHWQVPVVTLVHEFAPYTLPARSMGQALDWSTHVVFPADVVAAAAQKEHPTLQGRITHILPQGACPAPPVTGVRDDASESTQLITLSHAKERKNAFVVFGCGTIQLRKGVDLFLACAAAVAKLAPERPVRFLWIGAGFDPDHDANYSCYLADQIERAGLHDTVSILDAMVDLEPAYALADVFLLSSRLDPLPNVAIDAALRGIPIVCFKEATGIADLLSTDALTRRGVVPYLDVDAAADVLARLADREHELLDIGSATRRLAVTTFDTDQYVQRLDELGVDAMRLVAQRREDFSTLRNDPLFDASFYAHPTQPGLSRDEAISGFLARWHAVGLALRPATNGLFRRPCPGFHPQIYALENREQYDTSSVNPLAHFLRSGKPVGPWCHDVITPRSVAPIGTDVSGLKVALHGHFFYPELAADLIRRVSANSARCDLLLTTDDQSKVEVLEAAASGYRQGNVDIRLVPNRGRDLGPLLTGLAKDILSNYDVVGHVHGKRSLAIDSGALGDSWREFLWQHLVGASHPMMDLILGHLDRDRQLGIVFPDDSHLSDWDDNRDIALKLAKRIGIAEPLAPFFNFPIGSMFWARTDALRPLLVAGLDWSDYPKEPVPPDGTLVHAVERLLPFVARHAGYRFATTHVPGVTR